MKLNLQDMEEIIKRCNGKERFFQGEIFGYIQEKIEQMSVSEIFEVIKNVNDYGIEKEYIYYMLRICVDKMAEKSGFKIKFDKHEDYNE